MYDNKVGSWSPRSCSRDRNIGALAIIQDERHDLRTILIKDGDSKTVAGKEISPRSLLFDLKSGQNKVSRSSWSGLAVSFWSDANQDVSVAPVNLVHRVIEQVRKRETDRLLD